MKYCIDCVHCGSDPLIEWKGYVCWRCGSVKEDPVVGWLVGYVDCHKARQKGGMCGPDAKLFEQRGGFWHNLFF